MVNSFSPVLHLILKPVTCLILKPVTCFAFLVNATILFILKTRENQNFTEITLRHKIYPVNMLHLIRTPFLKNKSVRLLLNMCYLVYYHQKLPFGVIFRSSRPEVFCKKGVLRNFAKFTGKHLCQSLFQSCRSHAWNFIKKETLAEVFFCEFCENSKSTFSYRIAPVAASERGYKRPMG